MGLECWGIIGRDLMRMGRAQMPGLLHKVVGGADVGDAQREVGWGPGARACRTGVI